MTAPWARALAILLPLLLIFLTAAGPALALEEVPNPLTYDAEVWLWVLEPTEAYRNIAPGHWENTGELHWVAHPTEWYVVLILKFEVGEVVWVAAVRESDPEGIVVWLALDERIELYYADESHPPCSLTLSGSRCVGRPLSTLPQ